MQRISHRVFALGLSSAIAFLLNINVIALPLILVLAYFIGSIPDLDLKAGIRHRGFTHSVLFFLTMTILCSLGVFYFYYFLQLWIGVAIFDVEMFYPYHVPLPAFFMHVGSLDFVSAVDDSFFKLLAFFFASFLSHFLLDIITPVGLDVGSLTISGTIRSSNSFFNFFFSAVGFVTFLISVSFSIVREFTTFSIDWITWYFVSVGIIVSAVIIGSVFLKRGRKSDALKCFKLDNNIDVCIPKGKCLQIGPDKDDKICNTDGTN